MATLANLLIKVRADTGTLATDLRKVGRQTRSFAGEVGKTQIPLRQMAKGMLAVGAAGAGMAFVAKQMFDVGAAVEETANKYRTVLGPAIDETNRFLDEFATVAGLSRRRAQETVATTAAMAQGFGFGREAAAALARDVVRLGGDLASFNNLQGGAAEGAEIISTALAGERERLKRLGIVVMEAEVQARALATSGKEAASELSQMDKAAASLALITEKAGVAVGDLARTQDSAANTARRIAARFEDIRDTVATGVMPALEALLPVIEQLADKADTMANSVAGAVAALMDLAGLADQEIAIEIAAIRRQGFDEAGLFERLQVEARGLTELEQRRSQIEADIERMIEAMRQMPLVTEDEIANATRSLRRNLEAVNDDIDVAGAVMNYLSRELSRLADEGDRASASTARATAGIADMDMSALIVSAIKRSAVLGVATAPARRAFLERQEQARRDMRAGVPTVFDVQPLLSPVVDASDELAETFDALTHTAGQLDPELARLGGAIGQIIQATRSQDATGILGMLGVGGAIFGAFQVLVSALDRNTEEVRRNTLSFSDRADLLMARLDALDITDPFERFFSLLTELRQRVTTTPGLESNLPETLRAWLDQLWSVGAGGEGIGALVADLVEKLLAGGRGAADVEALAALFGMTAEELIRVLSEIERLGDEVGSAADEMERFGNALRNVPTGFFDPALIRRRIALGADENVTTDDTPNPRDDDDYRFRPDNRFVFAPADFTVPVPEWLPDMTVPVPEWLPFMIPEPDWLGALAIPAPEVPNLSVSAPEWLPDLTFQRPSWIDEIIGDSGRDRSIVINGDVVVQGVEDPARFWEMVQGEAQRSAQRGGTNTVFLNGRRAALN